MNIGHVDIPSKNSGSDEDKRFLTDMHHSDRDTGTHFLLVEHLQNSGTTRLYFRTEQTRSHDNGTARIVVSIPPWAVLSHLLVIDVIVANTS